MVETYPFPRRATFRSIDPGNRKAGKEEQGCEWCSEEKHSVSDNPAKVGTAKRDGVTVAGL